MALVHGVLIGTAGQFGDVRTADRGYVAVVHAPSRHRGRDLRQRQLSRRHDLAAGGAAFRGRLRLARHATRASALFAFVSLTALALLMRRRPPVVARYRRAHARGPRRRRDLSVSRRPQRRRSSAWLVLRAASRCRCRRCTSSPTVPTSAWCCARRADAVDHARLRHREPPAVGRDLRSDRRPAHVAARLGAAGCGAAPFLALRRAVSLFVISALFGLFQGGIVPSYAIIIREYFPAHEAGGRVGTVLMFTLFGMALGGWMSGKVFDLTGSYNAAFINGIAWNLLNMTIAVTLLRRSTRTAARLDPYRRSRRAMISQQRSKKPASTKRRRNALIAALRRMQLIAPDEVPAFTALTGGVSSIIALRAHGARTAVCQACIAQTESQRRLVCAGRAQSRRSGVDENCRESGAAMRCRAFSVKTRRPWPLRWSGWIRIDIRYGRRSCATAWSTCTRRAQSATVLAPYIARPRATPALRTTSRTMTRSTPFAWNPISKPAHARIRIMPRPCAN